MKHIFFLSLIIMPLYSMDMTCHLARMPKDVQDYIAGFLPFKHESDADFIDRTQAIDLEAIEKDVRLELAEANIIGIGLFHQVFGISPDQSKIIFVKMFGSEKDLYYKYYLFDREKKKLEFFNCSQKKDILLHHFRGITIANNKRIAEIFKKESVDNKKILLSYQDDQLKEWKQIELPYIQKFESCHFNKQGTKIIVRAIDSVKNSLTQIIPVVSDEMLQKESHKTEKTLTNYLLQTGACKDLRNSLK